MKNILLGVLLLSSSFTTYAYESLYLKLLDTERSIFLISSSFHQYSLEDGGKANKERISNAINTLNKSLSSLKTHYYTGSDISINELIRELEGFHSASINLAKQSFDTPELFVSNDLKRKENGVITKIRAVQSILPTPPTNDQLTVMKLESLTAELLSEYLHICEYTLSSRAMASERDIKTIEDRIAEFDILLDSLQSSDRFQEWEVSFLKAEKRWKYFSKHLVDFDKSAVPFAISRFSYSLTNALADIE